METKAFDIDVVDLLIQITADALNLNIHIFQNNKGKTQQLEYSGRNCCNDVFVKFSHDPLFSGFNHYELIIKILVKEEKEEVIMTDGNDAEANSDGMILLDEIILNNGTGKPFPTYLFATMKATEVESIPNNIDGFQLYKINITDKDWTKVTSDQ